MAEADAGPGGFAATPHPIDRTPAALRALPVAGVPGPAAPCRPVGIAGGA